MRSECLSGSSWFRAVHDFGMFPRRIGDWLLAGTRYVIPLVVEGVLPWRSARRKALVSMFLAGQAYRDGELVSTVLMMVYRRKNVPIVRVLLGQVDPSVDIRLWALDEVDPVLESMTVGVGGGSKFELLNRLYAHREVPPSAYVAVADDDVCFASGNLTQTIAVAHLRGLGVFQPSHGWCSIYTYQFLLSRPWLQARSTGFVESGPLFIVAPSWRDRVFPLPEDIGMGWGIEVSWHQLMREGCRLGVVDACRILHMAPVGKGYDSKDAKRTLLALLAEEGMRSPYELMKTYDKWGALVSLTGWKP